MCAMYAGDELCVNWVAGQSSHSGNFPIRWLQENNYSSPDRNTRQGKPTAVSWLMFLACSSQGTCHVYRCCLLTHSTKHIHDTIIKCWGCSVTRCDSAFIVYVGNKYTAHANDCALFHIIENTSWGILHWCDEHRWWTLEVSSF